MSRDFQRTVENFQCLNCGIEVTGNGYTNHCPNCLWSRHVDINPGDRWEMCKGMMPAIAVSGVMDNLRILHRCQKCGEERWNNSASEDRFEALLGLAEQSKQPRT